MKPADAARSTRGCRRATQTTADWPRIYWVLAPGVWRLQLFRLRGLGIRVSGLGVGLGLLGFRGLEFWGLGLGVGV